MILTPEVREIVRKNFLYGEDEALLLHLGHFVKWFGILEVHLTRLLAVLTGNTNMKTYHILVKGMDARVTCDRIRAAAKVVGPMTKELDDRFAYFERTIIPIRNKLAHSWPHYNKKTNHVQYLTVSSISESEFVDGAFSKAMGAIHIDDLFDISMWINSFASDIQTVTLNVFHQKGFVISDLKSDPPTRCPLGPRPQVPRAKSDKLERKPRSKQRA